MKSSLLTTRWQHLSEEVLVRMQMAKLRRFLKSIVIPFSPYYREMFHKHGISWDSLKTMEDLARIPFTTKSDLANSPGDPRRSQYFIITPEQSTLARRPSSWARMALHGSARLRDEFEREFRPVFLTSTTGRSADPIPFVFTNYDLDLLAIAGKRIMQVCGARREFKLLNLFPYAPHLAFWLTHYASSAFGIFTLSTGGGKVMGTSANLKLMEKLDPNVLIGMPTFLYHLLQQAVEEGVRCNNICRLVLGGEKVADGMRRKLRLLASKLGSMKVDVVATYGFTEAKMAWAECPHPPESISGGYHLYPDLGIIEVVDPTNGMQLPAGHPGEIVFTTLDARGTVVLRYRTGDIIDGGLYYKPCPHCGRSLPRLVGKISRDSEVKSMQLDKIKGTLVDFNQLEHVLDDAPYVDSWQLELRKINDDPFELDELILHVHKAYGASEEKLDRELRNRFLERTEIRPNRIVFHNAEELRQLLGFGRLLKEQKIIDNRPGKNSSSSVAGSNSEMSPEAVCKTASGPINHRSALNEIEHFKLEVKP